MYRTTVVISLAAALLVIGLHFVVRGRGAGDRTGQASGPPAGRATLLLYFVVLLSTTIAAISAWIPIVAWEAPMRGWMLLLHSFAAGAFIVSLASLVFFWAGGCRMAAESDAKGRTFTCGLKLTFSLAAVMGLLVILSSLLPMTPMFSTEQQELLVATHRYAGLGLVLTLVFHRYLLWLSQRRSRAMSKGILQHESTTA